MDTTQPTPTLLLTATTIFDRLALAQIEIAALEAHIHGNGEIHGQPIIEGESPATLAYLLRRSATLAEEIAKQVSGLREAIGADAPPFHPITPRIARAA